jgi:membrane-associated phospholipid phosphatase
MSPDSMADNPVRAELGQATQALIRPWHWALPLIVAMLTAPLWLGVFEPHVFYFFNRNLQALPDLTWSLLSLLGTGWGILALTSPALWLRPRLVLAWVCAAPMAGVFTRIGKTWANSVRPLEVLDASTVHVIGEPLFVAAMPSGHTLTAFAAAAALYFALPVLTRGRHLWLYALALSVGLSRMGVGAHWPADVAMGAVLGLLCGLSGAWLCGRIPARHQQVQSGLTRVMAVLGLYALYVLLTDPMGFVQNRPYQYVLAGFLGLNLTLFGVKTFHPASHSTPTGAP